MSFWSKDFFCFNTNHKSWASVTSSLFFACLFDLFNVSVNRVEYTIAKDVQCVLSKRYMWKFTFHGGTGLYTHAFPTTCGSVY